MDNRTFNSSIREAYSFLIEVGLARECISINTLPVNSDFNKAALKGAPSHESLFFKGLELGYYNLLMSDYSFFQFSLTSEAPREELRLAYYANPMSYITELQPSNPQEDIITLEEMFSNGEIDFEEFTQALSESSTNISSPIIRYDVSFNQFKKEEPLEHPIAHLHLGINNSSRVATDRIFSPKFFVMFIIRTFYYNYWKKKQVDSNFDIKFSSLKQSLYKLSEDDFCNRQKGLLNFI